MLLYYYNYITGCMISRKNNEHKRLKINGGWNLKDRKLWFKCVLNQYTS